ncbi:MAG: stage II sporulation protein M [Lewinellaceae bacterium]|nr:stage II sporulation protein M [Lewinellaceae bacterium]
MRETRFIDQNKEKWAAFEEMLHENRKEPEKLNDLFVQITDDLSYARTFYPNRSVRMYLNSMAQRIFHDVYRGKRFPKERFRSFWETELPQIIWESRKALLLAFSVFLLAFGIGVLSSMLNPEFAHTILGEDYVAMTLANIENKDPMAVYKASRPLGMTIGIAANNLFVSLILALCGVLAGVGSLVYLMYNGIMVGVFQYFFIERGLFWKSFLTIWIHGTLEISALIIAGGAGLVIGSGLLFPGTYSRTRAFQISLRRGIKILLGIVPIIVLAAIFEGFLTRYTETPDFIRGCFIALSLAFVLLYFVWYPWRLSRKYAWQEATPADLPPDQPVAIRFNVIKSSGEILSDAFTLLKGTSRPPSAVFLAALSCLPWLFILLTPIKP